MVMFNGSAALSTTIAYLDVHLLIVFVTAVFSGAILQIVDKPREFGEKLHVRLLENFASMAAFSLFGFVTAYFLAQGIDAEGETVKNSILGNFIAPYISLLTLGIAYLQIRTNSGRDHIVIGCSAFLLTIVLSYQTFIYQKA